MQKEIEKYSDGKQEATDNAAPRYNYQYVPRNPPHHRDISISDPKEWLNKLQGEVADIIDPIDDGGAGSGVFRRATCASACQACMIDSAENSGALCPCMATCRKGDCTGRPIVGWTDNTVSAPYQMWDGQCSLGDNSCDECTKPAFAEQVEECMASKTPNICFSELRAQTNDPNMDSRENVMYCIRKEMKECDRFMAPPTDKEWKCFADLGKCEASANENEMTHYSHTPNIWESVK